MASVAVPLPPATPPPEPTAAVQIAWPDDLRRWYLPEEHEEVGIPLILALLLRHLLLSLESLAEEEGRDWLVGSEQDMLLRADDLRVGVRPDVYLLPGRPKDLSFERWPAYEPDVPVPFFALELVSPSNWWKDYEDAPEKYTALGVNELLLVDTLAREGKSRAKNAQVFQLYRKGKGGRLERVYTGPGPVFSREVGVWWRLEGDLLLLSRDEAGHQLIQTREEKLRKLLDEERSALEALRRQAMQAKNAREEAERKAAVERAAREEAEQKAVAERSAKEEAEQKAAAERLAKEEAEQKAAAERLAKEEAERKAAAERLAKEEAERKAVAERLAKEEAERKVVAERLAKEEAEQKAAAERLAKEEAEEARGAAEQQVLLLARAAIEDLCDAFQVELTPERQAQLKQEGLDGLAALRKHLKEHHRWP
jgi:Uma2 family endonuclease